jgi:archaellum component FlaC
MMAGFAELMAKRGMTPVSSSSSGPRQKALSQANSMLSKISKYSSADQMNSETSNQNWWGTAPRNGKRRVTVRYDNKIVPDLATEVDDDIGSVKEAIENFRVIIQEVDDEAWAAEEIRRETEKKKREK